jgi:uncharacterized protein
MTRPPLRTLDLDITEKCPLACDYCYKHKQARTMSREMAFRAMDWLFKMSGKGEKVTVNFIGGEPMAVFPFMREVVEYGKEKARQSGKLISFGGPTSASVVTDEILEFIRVSRYPLVLSIDGAPETQDRHRRLANGRGSSELVSGNVQRLLKISPYAQGRMTVTPESAGCMCANIRYLMSIGFKRVVTTPAYELDWSPAQLDELTREMRAVSDLYMAEYRAGRWIGIKFLDDSIQRMIARKPRHWACAAGRTMLGVDVEGNIFPCHRFLGLGKDHPMWMGTLDNYDDSVRDHFLNLSPRTTECDSCIAAEICAGGCYFVNFLTQGDLTKSNPRFCRYIRDGLVEGMRVNRILLREKNPLFLKKFYPPRKTQPQQPQQPVRKPFASRWTVQASAAWPETIRIVPPRPPTGPPTKPG